ncbi:MAG TPA: hypothetical protein VMW09_04815 [Desulfatiglandales bacterium]|nr:hypothetical protein [Desulfatiglandales bacterium]
MNITTFLILLELRIHSRYLQLDPGVDLSDISQDFEEDDIFA